MNTYGLLEAIDQRINQLQLARALLAGALGETDLNAIPKKVTQPTGKRRGRPIGSVNKKPDVSEAVVKKGSRRPLTAEGKARIAAAQKARWAARRQAIGLAKLVAKRASAKPPAKTATSMNKGASAKRESTLKSATATSTKT